MLLFQIAIRNITGIVVWVVADMTWRPLVGITLLALGVSCQFQHFPVKSGRPDSGGRPSSGARPPSAPRAPSPPDSRQRLAAIVAEPVDNDIERDVPSLQVTKVRNDPTAKGRGRGRSRGRGRDNEVAAGAGVRTTNQRTRIPERPREQLENR